jgi:hypothetical protein
MIHGRTHRFYTDQGDQPEIGEAKSFCKTSFSQPLMLHCLPLCCYQRPVTHGIGQTSHH